MKKIFLTIATGLFVLGFSQNNYDYNQNYDPNPPNYNQGNSNYNQGNPNYNSDYYYGNQYDYPQDYYSEYPQDYYADDYYRSNYNDYNQSVVGVNWNNLFVELSLSPLQINQITVLNRRFPTYVAWNNYYRVNPSRWYYDRFYGLQRILTPQQFVVFQNRYYRGMSPIVYFTNYHRTYYVPRYRVMPQYRYVDVRTYRRSPWVNGGFRGNGGVIVRNNNVRVMPRENNAPRRDFRIENGRRDQAYFERGQNRNNNYSEGNRRTENRQGGERMQNFERRNNQQNNGGNRNFTQRDNNRGEGNRGGEHNRGGGNGGGDRSNSGRRF